MKAKIQATPHYPSIENVTWMVKEVLSQWCFPELLKTYFYSGKYTPLVSFEVGYKEDKRVFVRMTVTYGPFGEKWLPKTNGGSRLMQAFYYHPKHGAIAIPDNDNLLSFLCPQCHIAHGPPASYGVSAKYCDKCVASWNKGVDNSPSPKQNTDMCMNVKFQTAVLMAVKEVSSRPSFSAFDVTTALRGLVNQGEVALTDKTTDAVGGLQTYRIEHQEVNDLLKEMYAAKVMGLTRVPNGTYFEYSVDNVVASTPMVKATPATPATAGPVGSIGCGCPTGPTGPVGTTGATCCQTSPPNATKLINYLSGRGVGSQVTMKQIQSRFDTLRGVTCEDYAKQVASLGYLVQKDNGKPVSEWYVQV
jgi:hypothetical protein